MADANHVRPSADINAVRIAPAGGATPLNTSNATIASFTNKTVYTNARRQRLGRAPSNARD